MLVLTRKASQQIVIDDRITITVIKLQGNRVCLGIEAPQEIAVNRAEILFGRPPQDESSRERPAQSGLSPAAL